MFGRSRVLVAITAMAAAGAMTLSGCGSSGGGSGSGSNTSSASSPSSQAGTTAGTPSGSSSAQSPAALVPAAVKAKGTFVIASDASYPPMEFFKPGTKSPIIGMDVSLLLKLQG